MARRFLNPSSGLYLVDHPNERSLHDRPMPRGGGIAIFVAVFAAGTVAALAYGDGRELAWLAAGAGVIGVVSYRDDHSHVHPLVRLGAHVVAAAILVAGGFYVETVALPGLEWRTPAPLGLAISLLFIVWMVNLYNFMDGMDGFAGGMAVIGFGFFALLAQQQGEYPFMALSLLIAAASGGFLLLNFPPARIFMGDVGSSGIGYGAAGLILWADRDQIFPWWIGGLVFSPFIVDATATLVRRLGRRERVWEAHKSHYYQRLVELGWGHRRTVLAEYVLMAGCGVSAVVALAASPGWQWTLLAFWLIVYAGLMVSVDRAEARREGLVS